MKKLFTYLGLKIEGIINWIRGYELTKEDLINLDEIVTIAGHTISEDYHPELYDRACRGCKLSLDILLKSKDRSIEDLHRLNLNDVIVITFKTRHFQNEAIQKLLQTNYHQEWQNVNENVIYMRVWLFMFLFHEELSQNVCESFNQEFTILKDESLLD